MSVEEHVDGYDDAHDLDLHDHDLHDHDLDPHGDDALGDDVLGENPYGATLDGDLLAPGTAVGTPELDAGVWHEQERDNTCAVAAQEFVLDELTGVDHSEAELRDVAEAHGWWDPVGGTPAEDVGKLLAHYGIDTDQQVGASLGDLETALAHGDGVIVGVDSGEIWNPGAAPDDALTDYLGIPGQGADHAVQVTGVDYTDPAHPVVVLNDSGTPDGRGERVPLSTFLDAWADSDHFMVVAHHP